MCNHTVFVIVSTSTASTQSILIGRRKAGRPPDPMRNLVTDCLFSWPRRPQPFQKEFLTRSDNKSKPNHLRNIFKNIT